MDLPLRLIRMRAPLDSDGEANWSTPETQWDKQAYWGSLQPVGSKEDLVSQNRVESTHVSRWEPATDITPYDRVRDPKGLDYTVDGEPGDWSDVEQYGQEAHWKVSLKRITGA